MRFLDIIIHITTIDFSTRKGVFLMSNWEDFKLPLHIYKSSEYLTAFNKMVNLYYKKLSSLTRKPKFIEHVQKIDESLSKLKEQQELISKAFNYYLEGKQQYSIKIVTEIIEENKDILIRPIKKAYGFNGNGMYAYPENDLNELFLVRGRKVNPYQELSANDMLHISLNKRELVDTYRYSIPGVPGLYLSSNSYILWNELQNPPLDQLAISCFDLTGLLDENIIDISYYIEYFFENLNHLRNSNLASDAVDFVIQVFRIIPLIIACSVVCDDPNPRRFKVEYLFPQLLMQYLNKSCIGIAYRSSRIESGNLLSTNLAIPILDFEMDKEYGNIIKKIKVSDSLNIGYFNNFVFNLSETSILNNGKGPGAKRGFYSSNRLSSQFPFNMKLFDHPESTYDDKTDYKGSVFYSFDEYLFYKNELKKIDI